MSTDFLTGLIIGDTDLTGRVAQAQARADNLELEAQALDAQLMRSAGTIMDLSDRLTAALQEIADLRARNERLKGLYARAYHRLKDHNLLGN